VTAQPIETERVSLEPLRVEHAAEMASVLDDPGLHRFTGGRPDTPGELRARYERWERGAPPGSGEAWLNWIVREQAAGVAVGTVQATVRGPAAEVAWVVGSAHQGRGYAKEAAAAMVDWLRAHGVRSVAANVHPEHMASMAVARHIGLAPTGAIAGDGEARWST
jgi:RimJ/RimL family protein N-acetyltransferase